MVRSTTTRRRALAMLGASIGTSPLAGAGPSLAGLGDADPAGSSLGIAIGFDSLRWQSSLDLSREFADCRRMGARWLRTDLYWGAVQAGGRDSFDWSEMDRVVALAQAAQLEILPVIGSSPEWSWATPGQRSSPTEPADYARFAAAAVDRYRPMGLRAWEIWNEPNLADFWPPAPDPAAYARLLIAAHGAIKQADPKAIVIAGGLSPVGTAAPDESTHVPAVDFLAAVYEAGAGSAFDALGFHPYSYPAMPSDPAEWSGWTMMTGPIRALMKTHGDAEKPVWITEYGAPTYGGAGGVSEEAQAEMITEAYRLARSYPWAGPFFCYSYRDLGDDPADREDWFGVVRRPGEPKLSYARLRRAVWE